jgi:hypothetical protein
VFGKTIVSFLQMCIQDLNFKQFSSSTHSWQFCHHISCCPVDGSCGCFYRFYRLHWGSYGGTLPKRWSSRSTQGGDWLHYIDIIDFTTLGCTSGDRFTRLFAINSSYCCLFTFLLACTRWFKYDWDDLCVNKSQFVLVIFELPCIYVWFDNIAVL